MTYGDGRALIILNHTDKNSARSINTIVHVMDEQLNIMYQMLLLLWYWCPRELGSMLVVCFFCTTAVRRLFAGKFRIFSFALLVLRACDGRDDSSVGRK